MSAPKEGLSKTELEKGLAQLEAVSKAPSRRQELFQKAESGEITDEERTELVKSLASSESLAAMATSALTDNSTLQKSLDVSEYLRENHAGTVAALETLANALEKSETREQDFRLALGQTTVALVKSMQQATTLLQSLSARLEVIENQPVGMRKSLAAPPAKSNGVMEKSFAGQPAGDGLTKSQISNVMSEMLEKGDKYAQVGGVDLLLAATKFETDSTLHPAVLAAVQSYAREHHRV